MWTTIQDMIKSNCIIVPTVLSEIIRILGKAKMVNKACSIFYQIKARKCRPTSSVYNTMIIMLMQEGHHEKVHELYNEMCDEGNCFPDSVTYSALISIFCKLGRDDSAIRLFEEMKENRMQPMPKICTTLVAMFFNSKKADKALGLFREMKQHCCKPNVFTYTELIKGLGKIEKNYSFWEFPVFSLHSLLLLLLLLLLIFVLVFTILHQWSCRKYDEIEPPNVEDFCYITDNT